MPWDPNTYKCCIPSDNGQCNDGDEPRSNAFHVDLRRFVVKDQNLHRFWLICRLHHSKGTFYHPVIIGTLCEILLQLSLIWVLGSTCYRN
ncbi:hypothetical protein GDO78_010812 [Eleutherodactylus coqui]|uniref:Uncharacterized protein n=1 Tax=Eleutherodactylus coqui TaxID=57060 RepID=A0A8J6F6V8_ELECQ|nr:hypothetical protein GDO78_010812 [Eleutherodactylus coqui]